jgi:hypothetical protein
MSFILSLNDEDVATFIKLSIALPNLPQDASSC